MTLFLDVARSHQVKNRESDYGYHIFLDNASFRRLSETVECLCPIKMLEE